MDLGGSKRRISEKVEEAVKRLKSKEKTIAQKQMEALLNDGVDPMIKAAKDKFLSMDTKSQAAWRKRKPRSLCKTV